MALLPKISKLRKIPDLLRHKRDEEEQNRKRQQERERNSKFIIDEVTISQASKSHMEVETPFKLPEVPEIIKEKDDGKGIKIDLKV
jgi:hypothetical protein